MKNRTVSPRLVLTTLAVLVTSLVGFEWRALYALDHPPLHRTNCVTCHSDAKTMKAMADKAGDELYLQHRGDLGAAVSGAQSKQPGGW
jgi:mono/diheme cytochrome c family protein